jgi:hypothetical protein
LSDIYQALARTALLIELDIFGPGADHHAIIDGLRDTTARIITDRANIDTPAGQTALVTLYALLAMQGLRIDPDVPATPMRSSQPPLRGTSLPPCSTTPPTCSPADQPGLRQPRTSPSPWATPRPRQARSNTPRNARKGGPFLVTPVG